MNFFTKLTLLFTFLHSEAYPYYEKVEKLFLGAGYESATNAYKGRCVVSVVDEPLFIEGSYMGSHTSLYIGSLNSSANHIFNAYGKATIGVKVANVWVQVDSHKFLSSDESSFSIVYSKSINYPAITIGEKLKISSYGYMALAGTPWNKREYCGDSFVESLTLNARFMASIDVRFRNKLVAEKFNLKIGAKLFWKSFETNIFDKRFDEFQDDMFVSVNFIQLGGSEQSANLLENDLRKNGGSCKLIEISNCLTSYLKLLDYMSSEFEKSLDQGRYHADKDMGPSIQTVYAQKYNSYQLNELVPEVELNEFSYIWDVRSIEEKIQEEINIQSLLYQKTDSLFENFLKFANDEKKVKLLNNLKEDLLFNVNVLIASKEKCQSDIKKCFNEEVNFKNKLRTYNAEILDYI